MTRENATIISQESDRDSLPIVTEPVPQADVERTLETQIMNLSWTNLTQSQRSALRNLCANGTCDLPRDLGDQLTNLGLAEHVNRGSYSVSPLGLAVAPTA